jgi:hypothetical protein
MSGGAKRQRDRTLGGRQRAAEVAAALATRLPAGGPLPEPQRVAVLRLLEWTVALGLRRTVALRYRSSASYQVHERVRCFYF